MAKVLMKIIVNSRLRLSVCGSLIARVDKIHIYVFTVCTVIFDKPCHCNTERERPLHSTKKKINVNRPDLEKKSNGNV